MRTVLRPAIPPLSRAASGPRAAVALRLALPVALALVLASCGDSGDPVQGSNSITGRWDVSNLGDADAILELRESGAALSGRLIVVDNGDEVGEYAVANGTVTDGGFSFTIDPLTPPLFDFLETIGSVSPLRVNGALVSHETLELSLTQTCSTEVCLETEGDAAFDVPLYSAEGSIDRPLGRPRMLGELRLVQNGATVTGSLGITYGTSQGGTLGPNLPVHNGTVTDENFVLFTIDPSDDPTGALAESLGCAGPIAYAGRPEQGSAIRFFLRQTVADSTGIDTCFVGSTGWTAAPLFEQFTATLPATIGGSLYDMKLVTEQEGSVVNGTVTFENDAERFGPLEIEDGRFTFGVATLTVRPSSTLSEAFVRELGSAAPITIVATVVGGETVSLTARQDCPCLVTTRLASRLPVGL
jgi:hypothetical protein